LTHYLVVNSHTPEQCEQMEVDSDKLGAELRGKDFYCTCPAGEHAFYMFVDGDTAEQVLGFFPPSFKMGKTRALPVETMHL
jgi:hypothetical protein